MKLGKWIIRKKDALDEEIEEMEVILREETKITSDDYKKILNRLEQLYDLRSKKNGCRERERISPNTVLVVAGGIAEILLIMNYENLHVISTKAWSRVLRGRI